MALGASALDLFRMIPLTECVPSCSVRPWASPRPGLPVAWS